MAHGVGTLAGNLHFNARWRRQKVGEGSDRHRALSALLPSLLSFLTPPINTFCYDVGLWSWPRGRSERRTQWFTLHRSDGQIEMKLWTQCYEVHVISCSLFNMVSVYSVSSVIFSRSSQCLFRKTYDLFHLRKTTALGSVLRRKWWLMTWIKFTYQCCHSVSLQIFSHVRSPLIGNDTINSTVNIHCHVFFK